MTLPEIIAARKAAEESKPELPKKIDAPTTVTSSTPTEKVVPNWNGIKPKSGYIGERIKLGDGSVIELTEWRPPKFGEGWRIGNSDLPRSRWCRRIVANVSGAATHNFETPRWFCKLVTGA